MFVAEGKAGHSRIVPISSRFFTTLAAYLTDERTDRDEVFVVLKGRRRGAPLSAAGILRGYLEGGGSLSSPAVVSAAPAALVSWVVENLEMAIEAPTKSRTPWPPPLLGHSSPCLKTVIQRQAVLVRCLSEL